MFKFKQSLLALAVILVLVGLIPALMPLVSQGQGKGGQKSGSRKFYLTWSEHTGGEARVVP